jgi:hypothetical protein
MPPLSPLLLSALLLLCLIGGLDMLREWWVNRRPPSSLDRYGLPPDFTPENPYGQDGE